VYFRSIPGLLALACCVIAIFAASSMAQNPDPTFVKDELLVKLRTTNGKLSANDRLARLGVGHLETLGDLGWMRVKLLSGQDPRLAAAELSKNEEIESAQPNYYYHLDATPNDAQWNNSALYGLRIISAPAAWDLITGSSSVVVANIDTGIRYTHEDLAANMWVNPGEIPGNGFDDDGNGFADDIYGYDFFYNDADPIDENGHGTHTSGTTIQASERHRRC
jgi:subtilisin family serine protease